MDLRTGKKRGVVRDFSVSHWEGGEVAGKGGREVHQSGFWRERGGEQDRMKVELAEKGASGENS